MIMIYISLLSSLQHAVYVTTGVSETGIGLSGLGELRHVQQNNVDIIIIHTQTHTHRYIWNTNIGKTINQV